MSDQQELEKLIQRLPDLQAREPEGSATRNDVVVMVGALGLAVGHFGNAIVAQAQGKPDDVMRFLTAGKEAMEALQLRMIRYLYRTEDDA